MPPNNDDRTGISRRGYLRGLSTTSLAIGTMSGWATATSEASNKSYDSEVLRDVTYASRPSGDLLLDLYLPQRKGPLPLVIFIHGGAWRAGSKDDSSVLGLGMELVERGYALASIEYRLSGTATFPAQIRDVKAAIRWLRAHADEYGLNSDAIGLWGSSAGGHLASLAGTSGDREIWSQEVYPDESDCVQAVLDWYGPTNFLLMDEQAPPNSVIDHSAPDSPESQLVGCQITTCPSAVEAANPITYISEGDPPHLIMPGVEDRLVPYQQSEILYKALRDQSIKATLYRLPNLGHGFGINDLTADPPIEYSVAQTQPDDSNNEDGEINYRGGGPPPETETIARFFAQHLRS